MKQRYHRILIFLIVSTCWGFSPKRQVEVTSDEIVKHIKVLASDRMEGRGAGTRGAEKAARYIKRQFRSFGLEPMGKHRSYYTSFEFTAEVALGKTNDMEWSSIDQTVELKLDTGFRPLGFSASGHASGELIFVGYGIDSEEPAYNDYAGLDISGKVVMVLRYSPDGTNPHGDLGKYAPLRYKAMTAREQGASAVIFVTGPEDDPEENYLMKLRYDQSFSDSGIPVVIITQRKAKELVFLAGENLLDVQKGINENLFPHSFEIPAEVTLHVSVEKIKAETVNIVGLVRGADEELKNEFVIIGAHYDHLGMGGRGSLIPDTVAVHNGADDNASGTAGLLELAQWFGHNPPKRSLIFAAFCAEERGLLGSANFISNPPVPLEKIVAMMNMDMIGRMEDSTLVMGGAGTSSVWKEMIESVSDKYHITPKFDDAGYGASDHQSFYLKDIPVLFFFSGTHDDYHRPSDDWEKINAPGEERIVKLIRNLVTQIADADKPPDFVKVEIAETASRGFAVYLGTIPDYTATDVVGMKLSGVRAGGPAEKGGMKGGDIIIKFGETTVENIYDFMYALQAAKADQPIEIVILREEIAITLEVSPGRRRD
ncbi:MAG: M28 family peptidase [Candidatus Marinimicrobia bacterium]|nr:M28 family peptidase [Candidatus Neomarinimicrobiota bacterium]